MERGIREVPILFLWTRGFFGEGQKDSLSSMFEAVLSETVFGLFPKLLNGAEVGQCSKARAKWHKVQETVSCAFLRKSVKN